MQPVRHLITHGWFPRRWRQRRWRTGRRSCHSGRETIAAWPGSGTRWPCVCSAPCGRASRSRSDARTPGLSINPSARWWGGRRWGFGLQERGWDTYHPSYSFDNELIISAFYKVGFSLLTPPVRSESFNLVFSLVRFMGGTHFHTYFHCMFSDNAACDTRMGLEEIPARLISLPPSCSGKPLPSSLKHTFSNRVESRADQRSKKTKLGIFVSSPMTCFLILCWLAHDDF